MPPERHGVDPLRLYLVKEVVFGDDGDFSWERFDERYNADLANNLGNLVSRVTAMAHQYRQGRLVPAGETPRGCETCRMTSRRDYRRAMDELDDYERGCGGVSIDRRDEPAHRRRRRHGRSRRIRRKPTA